MNLAEQIYESVKPLPPAVAQEVLDFVQFLAQRHAQREEHDLMLAQQSAAQEWDNPDDEVWNDVPAI